MSSNTKFIKANTIAILVGAACFAMSAAHAAPLAKKADYAEKIYTEYAASSDDSVSFDVNVAAKGKLKDLAGKQFSSIITAPRRKLVAVDNGFTTSKHAFEAADSNSGEFDDLNKTVADFEINGYPVAGGTYRILDVTATVGRDSTTHRAIEFCWNKQFHCVLLDPTIQFVDSIANTRIKLMAEGAGPKVTGIPADTSATAAGLQGVAGTCGVASHPSWKGIQTTYSAYNPQYKNVFGKVLVNKNIGAQQSGVNCDTSCKPKPFGYSNVSSAQGYLGWRTACAQNSAYGVTGTFAKYTGKTMCTHKYAVAASASISVLGQGASVDLKVDAGGSVDANGGAVYESCGYF